MATEKIFIQIDDEVIELKGADKETFLADRQATENAKALLETEHFNSSLFINLMIALAISLGFSGSK